MQIKHPRYFGELLLKKGFRAWFKYMFYIVEGIKFVEEDLHGDLFNQFERIYNLEDTRININIPPRSGKTTMAKYFIAYSWAKNPKSNFIYTSFSQSLLSDIARSLVDILEHPVYKAMYDLSIVESEEEVNPIDEFWQNYLINNEKKKTAKYSSRKIVSPTGGVILFSSIGASITGFGAGIRGISTFSGALMCFPYDEVIHTEHGAMKIGDIVENEINVKVWSFNHESGDFELKPITRYIKNNTEEKQTFVNVNLSNGKHFTCTDDHKVYTKNRGYIEAKDLTCVDEVVTFSNPFDLINTKASFFYNKLSRIVSIPNKIKFAFSKLDCFSVLINNIFSKTFKRSSCFNGLYSLNAASKLFGYFLIAFRAFANLYNIFFGQIASRKNKRSKLNGILHVVGFSAICKVFKPVIRWIAVKMPNFDTNGLFANKRPKNKFMNADSSCLSILSKINDFISPIIGRIKAFFFKLNLAPFINSSCKNKPFQADYVTKVGNLIKPFIVRNVFVSSVNISHYNNASFCLTVNQNHNLVVGDCKVLASNCDDGNKPSDMHSEVMRNKVITYFEETLLSRLNNPNAPIINIQQRLHLMDLTGVLLDKYKFKQLKKPLMVNDNCQLPSQYTQERIEEIQVNDYMFKSQYQQEPIQFGGFVFKTEWWKFYKELPQLQYARIYADTALKTKEHNDYSVFQLWGKGIDNNMYLIDQIRGKWEAYELENQAVMFWNKHKNNYNVRGFGIEDKASGTGLIQNLLRVHSLSVIAIQVDKDKYTRAMDIQPQIQSGFIYLPEYAEYTSEYINEFSSFSPMMTHKHDDMIDTTMHAISDMRLSGKVSILDVL